MVRRPPGRQFVVEGQDDSVEGNDHLAPEAQIRFRCAGDAVRPIDGGRHHAPVQAEAGCKRLAASRWPASPVARRRPPVRRPLSGLPPGHPIAAGGCRTGGSRPASTGRRDPRGSRPPPRAPAPARRAARARRHPGRGRESLPLRQASAGGAGRARPVRRRAHRLSSHRRGVRPAQSALRRHGPRRRAVPGRGRATREARCPRPGEPRADGLPPPAAGSRPDPAPPARGRRSRRRAATVSGAVRDRSSGRASGPTSPPTDPAAQTTSGYHAPDSRRRSSARQASNPGPRRSTA